MLDEYANIEDTIRQLWGELLNEHEHFIVRFASKRDIRCTTIKNPYPQALCDAKKVAFTLSQEQREDRHDAACRSMKSACKGKWPV